MASFHLAQLHSEREPTIASYLLSSLYTFSVAQLSTPFYTWLYIDTAKNF